jgi:formylglycine-generating enzyme required for sulfatase activity
VGLFCIDSTEVTNAQYLEFLQTNPSLATQTSVCSWNMSYTPTSGWPFAAGQEQHPVVYVDWCDAAAYCAWAGKRLCGRIGGGSAAYTDYANAMTIEQYHACTGGGARTYPYGNTYDPRACNGPDYDPQNPGTIPVGSLPTCTGGFPGIFDLSGNVAQWQDLCNGTTGPNDICRQGAAGYLSFASLPGETLGACNLDDSDPRQATYPDLGFRCCSDL